MTSNSILIFILLFSREWVEHRKDPYNHVFQMKFKFFITREEWMRFGKVLFHVSVEEREKKDLDNLFLFTEELLAVKITFESLIVATTVNW